MKHLGRKSSNKDVATQEDLENLKITTNNYVIPFTNNSKPRDEMRRMFFTYGKMGLVKLDFIWDGTGGSGLLGSLPLDAPTFNGLVEVQGNGDIVVYINAKSRNINVQGATKGKRYIMNLFGFLN